MEEVTQYVFKHFHSKLPGKQTYNCSISDIIKHDESENRYMFVNETVEDFYLSILKISDEFTLDDNFVGKILDQHNFQWNNYTLFSSQMKFNSSTSSYFFEMFQENLENDDEEHKPSVGFEINEDENQIKGIKLKTRDKKFKNVKEYVILVLSREFLPSENTDASNLSADDILFVGTTSPIVVQGVPPGDCNKSVTAKGEKSDEAKLNPSTSEAANQNPVNTDAETSKAKTPKTKKSRTKKSKVKTPKEKNPKE